MFINEKERERGGEEKDVERERDRDVEREREMWRESGRERGGYDMHGRCRLSRSGNPCKGMTWTSSTFETSSTSSPKRLVHSNSFNFCSK